MENEGRRFESWHVFFSLFFFFSLVCAERFAHFLHIVATGPNKWINIRRSDQKILNKNNKFWVNTKHQIKIRGR